jgi:TRAP-type C4-dicarboxylate transport system permease small subunit
VEAGSFALSMSYLYLSIPICFGGMFLLALRDLVQSTRALRKPEETA